MICPRCKKEVGDIFCGNCRMEIKGLQKPIENIIPFAYYNKETKRFHPACFVTECVNNQKGYCVTGHFLSTLLELFHEFDGDNFIHQACG